MSTMKHPIRTPLILVGCPDFKVCIVHTGNWDNQMCPVYRGVLMKWSHCMSNA